MSLPRKLVALAAVLGLPALLGACGLFQGGQVTVTPGSLSLTTTSSSAALTLTNGAGSPASWTASSTNARITVAPASGTIPAGGSVKATVTANYYGKSKGASITGKVTVESGATPVASVPVSFTMTEGGLDVCGTTYPSTFSAAAPVPAAGPSPAAAAPGAAPSGGAAPQGYVPHQVLVLYRTPTALSATQRAAAVRQTAAAVLAAHRLQLVRSGGPYAPDVVRAQDVQAAVASLRADARVAAAQPNYYVHPLAPATDPYVPAEWNMQDFGMNQAWNTEWGQTHATVIAIVDTGVQMNHPDLKAKMLPGCDVANGDADPNPGSGGESGHGTHVAGIAAAIGDNATGVAGVAYAAGAEILPVKIFDDSGTVSTVGTLANGILWAAGLHVNGIHDNPNPADVINVSAGVPGDQSVIDQAAQQAVAAGSLVVAAAGNHSSAGTNQGVESPANSPDVVAVGSVDSNYQISSFSNFDTGTQTLASGTGVELMAPGGIEVPSDPANPCTVTESNGSKRTLIISTYPPTTYACAAGTSMAAPFVAGIAALLKSQSSSRTPAQLRSILDGAVKPGSAPDPAKYGYGVVCADKAVDPTGPTTCGQ